MRSALSPLSPLSSCAAAPGETRNGRTALRVFVLLAFALVLAGCQHGQPRTLAPRKGDEIVVAGQLFHIGTPVVTWMDPGGYDAYRVERRFVPLAESSWEATRAAAPHVRTPNRYGLRQGGLTPTEIERVRGGGWDLPTLQRVVDQFVLHYDVCGISKACFDVLHDQRGLSVHFMLDVDGTIYQTLDLKERAWHATTSNDRSIGIEIANMGAYRATEKHPFARWYGRDAKGTVLTVPPELGDGAVRTPGFVGRPDRADPVTGEIQGDTLTQYDLTPEQYEALIKLTAALCTVFPKITCDYPRDAAGALVTRKLPDAELRAYQGVLGHFHIQTNKVDPGPALQWDRVINGARQLLGRR
ncbi:MAG: N-acetylmuramoyl-L-alanine amidase [Verrucomicrobia bacterium]|nr:N-acetylmuramoyl-L-alanine amidase [Verrucomicrobiota bacterium]